MIFENQLSAVSSQLHRDGGSRVAYKFAEHQAWNVGAGTKC